MRRLKVSLLLVGCALMLAGFNWPTEKTEKSSKAEMISKKAEVPQEAPVSHGSDLMEGTVTALDLEAKPAVVTLRFTSGQKTSVEITKDTTVFRKDKVLESNEMAMGNRLRVEYVTTGATKVAKNIEIVEAAVPVAEKKVVDAADKKTALKKSAATKSEPADKKLDE